MPFDGTISTHALNRARLIEALRNDKEWKWNFCKSSGCAIGMAATIWSEVRDTKDSRVIPLANLLGINLDKALDVFGFVTNTFEYSEFYKTTRDKVTPTMVADALEKLA